MIKKSPYIEDLNKINEWSSRFMKKEYGLEVVNGTTTVIHQTTTPGSSGTKYARCFGKLFNQFVEIRGAKREIDIIKSFIKRSSFRMPLPDEDLIQMSLFNSITVLYGKIFSSNSRNRPIPKPSLIFTEEEQEIHKELIGLRNTVFAHAGNNKHEIDDIHIMLDEEDNAIGYLLNFVDVAFSSDSMLSNIMNMVEKISSFYDQKSKNCLAVIDKKGEALITGQIEENYSFKDFHSKVFSYLIKFESVKYEWPPFRLISTEECGQPNQA